MQTQSVITTAEWIDNNWDEAHAALMRLREFETLERTHEGTRRTLQLALRMLIAASERDARIKPSEERVPRKFGASPRTFRTAGKMRRP